MRIRGHVIEAADAGDTLKITAQGQAAGGYADAALNPWLTISINVPNAERSRRAFYVGRAISVTVEPE